IVLSDEPPPGMILVRASALEHLGRLDEAEAAYLQCAAAPPHSAWAWVSLARLESRSESRAALAISHARVAAGLARHQGDGKAQAAAEALLSRLASEASRGG
ncbi:MAG: tetratricopeptide repeat protein, partial [Thermoanaerobaculia bacterium]|nr:tetratricopeptide repeat protein [Thermoanaerobaculia bacterium]